MKIHAKTAQFLHKDYERGEGCLRVGDNVLVHPFVDDFGYIRSQTALHFRATIVEEEINWSDGASIELCTHVQGGYSAVINEYLFSRLQKM